MSALVRRVKDFVCSNISAVLCSNSLSQAGYPFGSVTPYALDQNSRPIIYISLIAEHFKNLNVDGRASLCIQDPFGIYDPQAYARATLLGVFESVPQGELDAVAQIYRERFPNSESFQISHNFVYMRMQLEKIRWIGGFGQIAWIDTDQFVKAVPDPLAQFAFGMIEHMNNDHHDAILTLVRANDPEFSKVKHAWLRSISSLGLTIGFRAGGADKSIELKFDQPATTSDQARKAVINLIGK